MDGSDYNPCPLVFCIPCTFLIIMKSATIFCLFVALFVCFISCSELVKETESSIVAESNEMQEDPCFIPDSSLGGFMNFGYKYLTMKVPSDRLQANDMSLKMSRMLELLDSKCWNLKKSYTKGYLSEAFTEILGVYSEFRCQSLRRALIYGLIENFKSYQDRKADHERDWRNRGLVIADALQIVNSLIPENYFESSQVLVDDSVEFTNDMHKAMAFAWVVDFEPIFSFLKSLHYAIREALTVLIENEEYLPALKLISSGQASINPAVNFPAWLAMIEAPENAGKLNFVYGLLELGLLDINWKCRGKDMMQYALASKKYLEQTVQKLLTLNEYKLNRKPAFYLEYLQSEEVVAQHTPEYQQILVNCITIHI